MADQVTVSTFLELKDNMSKGLKRLEALLRSIESAAGGAKGAVDSFNKSARAAAAGIRIRRAALSDEEKQTRLAQRQKDQAEARGARAMRLAAERYAAFSQRQAAKAAAAQERDAARQARIEAQKQRVEARGVAFAAREAGRKARAEAKATEFAARQEQQRRAAIERSALNEIRETERVFARKTRASQVAARNEATHADAAKKQAARAAAHAQRMDKQRHRDALRSAYELRQVSSSAAGALSGALMLAGAGTAFKQIVDLGEAYEGLMMRIAGTLQAFRMTPTFGIAQKQAEQIYSFLHKQAAKLPGEVEDYASVFAAALPKAIASGMTDIQSIADFTSRYTAVAMANMVDSAQAGRDLFEMLSGRARSDVKTFRVLQEHIGMTAADFNKLSIAARRAKIDDALQNYNDLIAEFGNTFNAKFSTMISQAKELVRVGSKPLFEAAKVTIDRINKYLEDNHDRIVQIGNYVSAQLATHFGTVEQIAKTLGDNLSDVYDYTKAAIELWIAATTVSALSNLVILAEKLRDAFVVIEGLGLWKTLGLAGGAKFAIPRLGAAGIGLAGAATFLYSKDVASGEQTDVTKALLKAQADKFAPMQPFAAKYKKQIGYTGTFISGMEDSLMGMADYTSALADLYKKARISPGTTGEFDPKNILLFAESLGYDPERIAKMGGFEAGAGVLSAAAGAGVEAGDLKKTPKGRASNNYDFRFSRFDIKQEFAEGFDPDRIAVAFSTDLARLGEFRMQSAMTPTFSSGGT